MNLNGVRYKRIRFAFLMVQLAFWGQLGVVVRAYLQLLFTLGCDGSWGPCLSGGIYFAALPANMLGSFVIGVFAASSTLGLQSAKPMAVLPPAHSWQRNFELQIGIRTGFCGCLTTFATWVVELMTSAILYNTWINAVVGFIVGLQAALISYIMGTHIALYVDRWLLAVNEDVLQEGVEYRQSEMHQFREVGEAPAPSTELESMEPDLPKIVPRHVGAGRQSPLGVGEGLGRVSAAERLWRQQSELEDMQPDLPRVMSRRRSTRKAGDGTAGNGAAAADEESAGARPEPQLERSTSLIQDLRAWNKTDLLVLAALLGMSAFFAVMLALQERRQWYAELWLSCLLAPFGCTLRWFLSSFNYCLRGDALVWLPAGTLAANVLGTALSLGMQCVLSRARPEYWGVVALGAVQTGFCGSLTTVSTMVTEIVKFADVFPDSAHTYIYTAVTFGAGIVLALVIFGWVGWT